MNKLLNKNTATEAHVQAIKQTLFPENLKYVRFIRVKIDVRNCILILFPVKGFNDNTTSINYFVEEDFLNEIFPDNSFNIIDEEEYKL